MRTDSGSGRSYDNRSALSDERSRGLDLGPFQFIARHWKSLTATFAVLLCLTVVLTWPMALYMTAVPDEGDPLLNTWALSWVAHQLLIAPAHLVHANIFYPERYTLLFSESLILPAVMFAPLQWAGVHPVVVYNLVMASGMIFSGMGVALLLLELTGDGVAALIAGIAFAFLPFRMEHYSHMQLQQSQWIPMVLWALHRTIRRGRVADAVLVGVFAACQLLSCVYFGVMLIPFVTVVAIVIVFARFRLSTAGGDLAISVPRSFAVGLIRSSVCAVVVFGAIAAPLGSAYVRASGIVGERSEAEAIAGSAAPSDYLAAPLTNRMYGQLTSGFGRTELRLFPGISIVVLAAIGLVRRRSASTVAYVLALLVALDMSFGLHGMTYRLLWNNIGAFRGLRVPARVGIFVGLALSVLAGYGVAALRSGTSRSWMRRMVPAIAAALLVLEDSSQPTPHTTMPGFMPPVYAAILKDLADAPTTAIADLPIAAAMPDYMYYSLFHWQNLLSGYSGFFPPSFVDLTRSLEGFPDEMAMDALRRRHALYVVIHGEVYTADQYAALVAKAEASPDLQLVSRGAWQRGEMSAYRILPDKTQ